MKKLLLLTLVTFLFGGLMAQINVTMKVDMTDAEGFNPETDDVYVSGNIFGWPQPGTNADLKMTADENNPMIYAISAELVEAQEIQYKYFRVVNGAATWDLGEWTGDPNRKIYVVAEATLNDTWADQPFPVTFVVNMNNVAGFNPETDQVFIAGTVNVANNWQQPGTDPSLLLSTGQYPLVYTTTLMLYAGEYQYKYFRVINGEPSWDNGEWPGDPNRMISVTESTIISDTWGGPTVPTAMVQVIHNCADAAAAVVDVWLNDTKLLDDFPFRFCSPFVPIPAGVEFTISIKGPDSEDPNNPIWSNTYTLEDGKNYTLVADGILSATGYEPAKPFEIHVYDNTRIVANDPTKTDVLVFHGSTDAPTVSIYEVTADPVQLIEGIEYGQFADYLELPVANYLIQIRNAAGTEEVATYAAPLASFQLGGFAFTAIASGFLNIEANSNGPHFGLFGALPIGGALVPLQQTSSIQTIEAASMKVYPNPATSSLNIEILQDASKLEIYNVMGEKIQSYNQLNTGIMNINTANMAAGVYFINLHTNSGVQTMKFLKK